MLLLILWEGRYQSVARRWGTPVKFLGKVRSLLLSDSCQQSSASIRKWPSFLCVCLYVPSPLIRTAIILGLGPTLVQYHLILTDYISKDTISPKRHILSSGGHEFLRDTIQPGIDSQKNSEKNLPVFEDLCLTFCKPNFYFSHLRRGRTGMIFLCPVPCHLSETEGPDQWTNMALGRLVVR